MSFNKFELHLPCTSVFLVVLPNKLLILTLDQPVYQLCNPQDLICLKKQKVFAIKIIATRKFRLKKAQSFKTIYKLSIWS